MFNAIASSVASWRGIAILIVAWIVIAGVIQTVSPSIEDVSTSEQSEFLPSGTETLQALDLESEKFPAFEGLPAILIYRNPLGISHQDIALVAEIDALIRNDEKHKNIALVISDFDQSDFGGTAPIPEQSASETALEPATSPDGTAITITVVIAGSPAGEEFAATVDWLRSLDEDLMVELPATVQVTGPAGILADAIVVFQSFDFRVSAITIVLVLVILLIIYRSPLLALLPVITVGVALTVAQSIAALLADNFDLALNGQVTAIMAVLMFGAGTDFTLFIVSRYREELPVRDDKFAAIVATMRAVGPSIASSAGTTIVAMLALALALSGSLKTMGPMLAMAVAVMLIAALTLIPAVLVAMGRVAFWPIKTIEPSDKETGIWYPRRNAGFKTTWHAPRGHHHRYGRLDPRTLRIQTALQLCRRLSGQRRIENRLRDSQIRLPTGRIGAHDRIRFQGRRISPRTPEGHRGPLWNTSRRSRGQQCDVHHSPTR